MLITTVYQDIKSNYFRENVLHVTKRVVLLHFLSFLNIVLIALVTTLEGQK